MYIIPKINNEDSIDYAALINYLYDRSTNTIHHPLSLTANCKENELTFIRDLIQENNIEIFGKARLCPFCHWN